MASIDSLRYFPVVKIVPTSMFGEGHYTVSWTVSTSI